MVSFGDGVQTWINPRLSQVEPTTTELNRLQWMLSELEKKEQQQWLNLQRLKQEKQTLETEQQIPKVAALEMEQEIPKVAALEDRIAAMESSKFWKLRNTWFRIKRALGLKGE